MLDGAEGGRYEKHHPLSRGLGLQGGHLMVKSFRPGSMTPGDPFGLPVATAERQSSVLIVDDRPANLLSLEALLGPLGARMVQASSGEEALERLAVDEFALVLLDVQMPVLDGLETLARLRGRERGPKTPVLFVTAGTADPARVARAYQLGAVDFIAKPLDPDALRAKVGVFLELYAAREEVRRRGAILRARELADSDRKYRFLADATPEIVWTESPEGGMTYVNRRFCEYAGVPAERALGGDFGPWLHEGDVGGLRGARAAASRAGDPFEVECRLRRRDGAYRWFLARAVPRRDAEGAVVEWVGTATDIDDRKRAEAEREALLAREREAREVAVAAREVALEAIRAKDEFLAFVSHELRAPLSAIAGWAELLRDERLDDERRGRAIEVIGTNVEVQARLIDDLLDVARIEHHSAPALAPDAPADPPTAAHAGAEGAVPGAREPAATLPEVEVRPSRPPPAEGATIGPVRRRLASRPQLVRARVLVVDEDPAVRDFVASALRECGADVFTAESADEGFSIFQRERPDALVSGVAMPDEDGCGLMRNVRRLAPAAGGKTPAVALSASGRADDRARALLAGFTMYLTKPATADELVAVLSKLVELARP
jgi:PAS domain S-box-containing protein